MRETSPGVAISALGDLIGGSSDDPLVRMRFSALFGALISLFVEWTEGSLGADRRAFVDHVTEVAKQLIGVRVGVDR